MYRLRGRRKRLRRITVLALFSAVRLAGGLWPHLSPAHNGQGEDGCNIGNHLEELIGDAYAHNLEPDLQSIAESEEQAGQKDA